MEAKFLNQDNFRAMMWILDNHFMSSHKYAVSTKEENLLKHFMKNVLKEVHRQPSERAMAYIKRLNRICVINTIKIVTKEIAEQERAEQGRIQMTEHTPQTVNSSNGDLQSKFEGILQRRTPETSEDRPTPVFAAPIDEDNNKNIMKNFDEIAARRNNEIKQIESNMGKGAAPAPIETNITGAEPLPSDSGELNSFLETQPEESKINNDISGPVKTSGQEMLKIIDAPRLPENVVNKNEFINIHHLVIDSRDRNVDDYPDTHKYQVDFDTVYKDIISIELLSANVPKSQYIITSANNLVYFSEDDGVTTVIATIPVGNYTPSTLATAIGTAMSTIVNPKVVTVTADETTTNKMTFTIDSGNLELYFVGDSEKYGSGTRTLYLSNSIGPIIGFTKVDLTGSATYTGTSQYNLNGPTYVLMNIKEFSSTLEGSHNNSINKAFAKIVLDTDQSTYKFFKSQHDYIVKKEFAPILAKLGQLTISFTNYDGSAYDFSGLEHTLYFKLTTWRGKRSLGY